MQSYLFLCTFASPLGRRRFVQEVDGSFYYKSHIICADDVQSAIREFSSSESVKVKWSRVIEGRYRLGVFDRKGEWLAVFSVEQI